MSLLDAWKELPMFRPDNKNVGINWNWMVIIEGEGLDNNPRLSFEISVDDLYDAYKDGADTTVKLKGYKSLRWKQSPSLAILDKVRSGSVKDSD